MSGEQRPGEGCDCTKEWTTPWHAREALGEFDSMTERGTALRGKFAECQPRPTESRTAMVKEVSRQTCHGQDQSGEDRCCRHDPGRDELQ